MDPQAVAEEVYHYFTPGIFVQTMLTNDSTFPFYIFPEFKSKFIEVGHERVICEFQKHFEMTRFNPECFIVFRDNFFRKH